jgi:hypothetical protein
MMRQAANLLRWIIILLILVPAIMAFPALFSGYKHSPALSFLFVETCAFISAITFWLATNKLVRTNIYLGKIRFGGFASAILSNAIFLFSNRHVFINDNQDFAQHIYLGFLLAPSYIYFSYLYVSLILSLSIGFWIGAGITWLLVRPKT